MKKVAIVADNYKLEKFKSSLDAKGLKYEITPFVQNVSTIKVEVQDEKVDELRQLCQLVELHFKRSD